ncbi:MAG TPA: alpha-hydroxy acid oxidase [Mycobacteriales bacterium]|jgi:4-hydroxymandelate oxidase|nr:alpha-hydroxy acid oxidase [Mycobacteriales bacterium]
MIFASMAQLESEATARLDPFTSAYINGGAGDTPTENVRGWGRYRLRPRMLYDVSSISTETVLIGNTPVTCPILVAPTAMHRLLHPEGELATAQGAAQAGAVYVLSMASTISLEDVAKAAPGSPQWFQMYVLKDRGLTREACQRAAAAGFGAIVLTVDASVDRTEGTLALRRPVNAHLALPNIAPGVAHPDVFDVAAGYEPNLTFDDIADVSAWAGGLPVVVKGILRGDDAVRCTQAGIRAIAVSNHGGRQVAGSVSTAQALVDVVAAVGSDVDVLVDGGIRTGTDVVRALALGARAVMVGRPVLWGLTADGADGVHQVLAALQRQTRQVMGLCGYGKIADLTAEAVVG